MATVIIMPKQGQTVESCILTELKKKKGDAVVPGDLLFAYETDKASFEENSTVSGTVLELFFNEGDEVPVLAPVMVIGSPGEEIGGLDKGAVPATEAAPKQETPAEQAIAQAKPARSETKTSAGASPRAKALAAKQGVDLSAVAGTGPDGRIIERDVLAAMGSPVKMTPLARAVAKEGGLSAPEKGSGLGGVVRASDLVAGSSSIPDGGRAASGTAVSAGGYEEVPLTHIRKLIAKAMFASLQNSAQLTHHLGADARGLLEARKTVKKQMDDGGANITLNDMICFCVIRALKQFPRGNAHLIGDTMRIFTPVHLGLAVDTERGLMVPAVREADYLSLEGLSSRLKEVADACKKGSVNPDLLSPEAATFTVSNLGNYGVEMFTPIINLPQVAILGVNTIVPRPKDLGDGVYAFVPHIGLSLTYDHRALDGGEATRLLKQIAVEIERFKL